MPVPYGVTLQLALTTKIYNKVHSHASWCWLHRDADTEYKHIEGYQGHFTIHYYRHVILAHLIHFYVFVVFLYQKWLITQHNSDRNSSHLFVKIFHVFWRYFALNLLSEFERSVHKLSAFTEFKMIMGKLNPS